VSDPLAGQRLLPGLGREHPTTPWPSDYTAVSESVPTFVEALALKEGLIRRHLHVLTRTDAC
jgi:hypothetical protein